MTRRLLSKLYHLIESAPANNVSVNWFLQPGHFYSPLPDLAEIRRRETELFDRSFQELPEIDVRADSQLKLLETFAAFYESMPFAAERVAGMRSYLDNPRYAFLDAIVLHCMLRHLSPKRVIEVGSGYSTCVTLDTNDHFLGGGTAVSLIEPYAEVILSLLPADDPARASIIPKGLQEIDLGLFKTLEANDVLFIDSTHVAKIGSDVNHLFFKILPLLAAGVFIHIHDIFYPFEYPKEWIYEGRAWNEAYMLRAFLTHNSAYEIVFWNDFLGTFHRDALERSLPMGLRNTGGAIWLRKNG